MLRSILVFIFVAGLIYLVWPGPSSIGNIPPLPESLRSNEPGDTTQVKNITAYFSNLRRKDVTNFYGSQFGYLNILGFKIPPIKLNHPPEEAFTFVRDQQPSTYLEQYLYPFRDSLFVNGFEPYDLDGKAYREGATKIFIEGSFYDTKTTLRYYESSVTLRVFIYILVWIGFILLLKLFKKAIGEK